MNPRYPEVAMRAQHRCEYCRAPEAVFNFPFEVEHVVPLAHDGPASEANLALACRACNVRKGTRTHGVDSQDQTVARLFHPRDDRWEEHFRFDAETKAIEGLTAVGRATVSCLRLNDDAHLAARALWVRLGLFP